ncbi:MAG: hypothetical protein U9N45_05465, partial [Gemmatimonadota bacterium]|nr:hypothetical protein [Gemmatimonadota bacterium]
GPMKVVLARGNGPIVKSILLDTNGDGAFDESEIAVAGRGQGELAGVDAQTGEPFSSGWGSREEIIIEESGPQKVQLFTTGALAFRNGEKFLEYDLRLFFFTGRTDIRIQLTVRNTNTAGQINDRWQLGCEGSRLFDNLSFKLAFVPAEGLVQGSLFDGAGFEARQIPLNKSLAIHQESSGCKNWFHRNHVDKDNLVPLAYKGYRVTYGDRVICAGNRAAPWVSIEDTRIGAAVAVRDFWQNFPKELKVDTDSTLEVALWPCRDGGPHELQGGEQKTHEMTVSLQTGEGPGGQFDHWSTVAMSSFLDPLMAWAPSQWYMDSGVYGLGAVYHPDRFKNYEWQAQAPVAAKRHNIFKGREFIDEYGWRNFGDFLADNEPDETHGPNKGKLTLSHWNLAFDYARGMLLQCVRTRTHAPRISDLWWQVAGQGARHQSDIDTYHAERDEEGRFALGGKFFHTHHGVNAGRATHRSSPQDELWDELHWPWGRGVNCVDPFFFDSRGMASYSMLSGDRQVLRSVLELAGLVEYMVREDKNPQIDKASRQAGNNLQVLTDAWIISRDDRFRKAAETIVEKTMAHKHGYGPGDDPRKAELGGLGFTSVFFDALGRYIEVSDRVFGIKQKKAIRSHTDYTRFAVRYCWDDSTGIFCHTLAKGLKTSRPTGVWTYRVCDAFLYTLDYLDDPEDRKLLLKRTARAFRSAGPMNLRGREGYYFTANKNSNFVINGGPRCQYYMLREGR